MKLTLLLVALLGVSVCQAKGKNSRKPASPESSFKGDYDQLRDIANRRTLLCELKKTNGTGVSGQTVIVYGTTVMGENRLGAYASIQGVLVSLKDLKVEDANEFGKTHFFTINNTDDSSYTKNDSVECMGAE